MGVVGVVFLELVELREDGGVEDLEQLPVDDALLEGEARPAAHVVETAADPTGPEQAEVAIGIEPGERVEAAHEGPVEGQVVGHRPPMVVPPVTADVVPRLNRIEVVGADEHRGAAAGSVAVVAEGDLEELLPLIRAYCDFYETAPTDADLVALARRMIGEPELEGVQFLARDERGRAVGFASLFWSWDTTEGRRIGIMNDLFLDPRARGSGLAERLVAACRERCTRRGARRLEWVTAPDNARARALYERLGAVSEGWVDYALEVPPASGEVSGAG